MNYSKLLELFKDLKLSFVEIYNHKNHINICAQESPTIHNCRLELNVIGNDILLLDYRFRFVYRKEGYIGDEKVNFVDLEKEPEILFYENLKGIMINEEQLFEILESLKIEIKKIEEKVLNKMSNKVDTFKKSNKLDILQNAKNELK